MICTEQFILIKSGESRYYKNEEYRTNAYSNMWILLSIYLNRFSHLRPIDGPTIKSAHIRTI